MNREGRTFFPQNSPFWGQRFSASRIAGIGILGLVVVGAVAAPLLAPNLPGAMFADRAYAPPMRVHVIGNRGLARPFVHPQTLDDRLLRRYSDDARVAATIHWSPGRAPSIDAARGPLLFLGADSLGRDLFSRLLYGARWSLGVVVAGALGAILFGAFVGGLAATLGGRADRALMIVTDAAIILPGVYLVLVLRAVLPQVLSAAAVFWVMAGLFAIAGWPHVARGVRAILATERSRDYAEAARAAGAGPLRLLKHLLPAARGFIIVECMLLMPALLVAEATLSYLGLGFPDPTPSWGTMLQEAANVHMLGEAPWLLAPAIAMFLVVLSVQLVAGSRAETSVLTIANRPS